MKIAADIMCIGIMEALNNHIASTSLFKDPSSLPPSTAAELRCPLISPLTEAWFGAVEGRVQAIIGPYYREQEVRVG